jgi:hypothetical protein
MANKLGLFIDNETTVEQSVQDSGIWNFVTQRWNEYAGVWGIEDFLASIIYSKVDLFDDEQINFTESIQNIKDISKIFTNFTKNFSVPASRTNNKLFKHWHRLDNIIAKNQKRKLNARIEINHQHFQIGKVQINSVKLQNGRPFSYNITFFGNTVTLKDLLKDFKLSDLDYLSEFDHNYTSYDATNPSVYNGLTEGLDFTITNPDYTNNSIISGSSRTYTDAIIYPLITHTKRLFFDTSPSANVNYDGNLATSGFTVGTNRGLTFTDIKPALKVMHIVDAIQQQNWSNDTAGILDKPIVFSTDFFNHSQTELSNLYMWLHRNKGAITDPNLQSTPTENFLSSVSLVSGVNVTSIREVTIGSQTKSIFEFTTRLQKNWSNRITSMERYKFTIQVQVSAESTIQIIDTKKPSGKQVLDEAVGSGLLVSTAIIGYDGIAFGSMTSSSRTSHSPFGNTTSNIEIKIISNTTTTISNISLRVQEEIKSGRSGSIQSAEGTYTATGQSPVSRVNIKEQIPDIKCIDFLTGLFKMFNLTAFFEDDKRKANYGKIVIDTLDNYYADSVNNASGGQFDLNEYADNANAIYENVNPFSQINFKFQDPQTILAQNHKNIFNKDFGELSDPREDIDSGKTFKIELPFEHMKFERLFDNGGNAQTLIQVGYSADGNFNHKDADNVRAVPEGNFDPVLTKPLLFYGIRQTSSTAINFVGVNPNNSNNTSITNYFIPSNTQALFGTSNYRITNNGASSITINYFDTSGAVQSTSLSSGTRSINAQTSRISHNGTSTDVVITETVLTEVQTINFGAEVNEFSARVENKSLYKSFYFDYVNDLLATNLRLIKFNAFLPNKILVDIKPNDRIVLGYDELTINKVDINLNTGKSKFELINIDRSPLSQ